MPFSDGGKSFYDLFVHVKDIVLGLAGGMTFYIAGYYRDLKNGEKPKFSYVMLGANAFIGAFIGSSVGSGVPFDFPFRDAIVAFTGISSYQIVTIVESKFGPWIVKKVLNG